MAYFPIFINVENVKVLVIGLGCIAARRINVLKNFGAEITVKIGRASCRERV